MKGDTKGDGILCQWHIPRCIHGFCSGSLHPDTISPVPWMSTTKRIHTEDHHSDRVIHST